jgi:hypothetical protein
MPLPWLLPAAMTGATQIQLEITPVASAATVSDTLVTAIKVSFQTMPGLPDHDRFIWCDENGELFHMWDGLAKAEISVYDGPMDPITAHIVPPTSWILQRGWRDQMRAVQGWGDPVGEP